MLVSESQVEHGCLFAACSPIICFTLMPSCIYIFVLIILRMLVCSNGRITILEIYLKRVFDACLKRVPCQHNKIGTTCFRPVLCKCSHEVSMICIITCIFLCVWTLKACFSFTYNGHCAALARWSTLIELPRRLILPSYFLLLPYYKRRHGLRWHTCHDKFVVVLHD